MTRLRVTVPCSRPEQVASTDDFGNPVGEDRDAVEFAAVFIPPTTMAGSQIVDGVLRATTITKPTLMVEPTAANEDVFVAGAVRSGDPVIVDEDEGWRIDGDPADWSNALSGKHHLLVIELRREDG